MADLEFKDNLNRYCPAIFEFLEEEKISWASINKSQRKRFKEYEKKFERVGEFEIKASLFDVIISAKKGDDKARLILSFFENTLRKLNLVLDVDEKKIVNQVLFDVLVSRDEKYLNYVGELSALMFLKEIGFGKLLEKENCSFSVKPIDFLFKSSLMNEKRLVEIQNIHIENQQFNTFETLREYLNQKSSEKQSAKFGSNEIPSGVQLGFVPLKKKKKGSEN